jgi:hypothetical protein
VTLGREYLAQGVLRAAGRGNQRGNSCSDFLPTSTNQPRFPRVVGSKPQLHRTGAANPPDLRASLETKGFAAT